MKVKYKILLIFIVLVTIQCIFSIKSNASTVQNAIWFMDNMCISQVPDGDFSHRGTMNFDVLGYNGNSNIFAPFDCKVVAIYPEWNKGNTVVIESLSEVQYADGTIAYMSMAFAHDNNISDLYVGRVIKQGEVFYQTGDYGPATGPHSHVTCIRGKYQGDMWTKNIYEQYCSPNAIYPTTALFITPSTNVIQAMGMTFKMCYDVISNFNLADLGTGFTAAITYYMKPTDVKTAVTIKDITKGSNVQLSKQNGAWKKNQMWNFERQSDGSYYIKNVQSGYYLDVDYEQTTNGTNIKTWEKNNSNAQKWCIVEIDNGGYRLIPKHCYNTGVKACLDIDSGSMREGTNVQLWEYLSKPSDYWGTQRVYIEKTLDLTIEDLGAEFTAAITYYTNPTDEKAAVTIKDITKESNVQLSKQNGEWKKNQIWNFERQNDGSYYIKNVQSGYYLHVDNQKTVNGTNIKTWEKNGSNAQKWYIMKNLNGYRLIPKHCYDKGKKACLDIDSGSTREGTNVQLWEFLNESDSYRVTQIVNIEKYEPIKYELGDVNQDGKINARDAKLVLQAFNGNVTLTAVQRTLADINGDGKINARDAKLILQIFNGK